MKPKTVLFLCLLLEGRCQNVSGVRGEILCKHILFSRSPPSHIVWSLHFACSHKKHVASRFKLNNTIIKVQLMLLELDAISDINLPVLQSNLCLCPFLPLHVCCKSIIRSVTIIRDIWYALISFACSSAKIALS